MQLQKQTGAISLYHTLQQHEAAGNLDQAIKTAQMIVQTAGASVAALDDAFQLLAQNGQIDLAASALKQALQRDKVGVDAGYRYYALFGLTGAVEYLE